MPLLNFRISISRKDMEMLRIAAAMDGQSVTNFIARAVEERIAKHEVWDLPRYGGKK